MDAWMPGCPDACRMSHLALPCRRERQFEGQGGRQDRSSSASRSPLWRPAGRICDPFKMVESGIPACMEAGMLGCGSLEVCQDWQGLAGFGDPALKDFGVCSCNLARSSSGRGRRIYLKSLVAISYVLVTPNTSNVLFPRNLFPTNRHAFSMIVYFCSTPCSVCPIL